MKTYFQCKLLQGSCETIGWIEQRGAKVGAFVELPDEGPGLWKVLMVYPFALTEKMLKQKQANDRNALPSLAGKK